MELSWRREISRLMEQLQGSGLMRSVRSYVSLMKKKLRKPKELLRMG